MPKRALGFHFLRYMEISYEHYLTGCSFLLLAFFFDADCRVVVHLGVQHWLVPPRRANSRFDCCSSQLDHPAPLFVVRTRDRIEASAPCAAKLLPRNCMATKQKQDTDNPQPPTRLKLIQTNKKTILITKFRASHNFTKNSQNFLISSALESSSNGHLIRYFDSSFF